MPRDAPSQQHHVHGSSRAYIVGCYLWDPSRLTRQPPPCSISGPYPHGSDKWSDHDPILNIASLDVSGSKVPYQPMTTMPPHF
ncbi:hypothetical protein NEUTE2DRAFT_61689 [Neurospora tetrasperma FGSC 2509]|nr:hypothetical protein NEUTE2DRAFT_61689 [Neurospora tetrasperma FGSC 2509]